MSHNINNINMYRKANGAQTEGQTDIVNCRWIILLYLNTLAFL